MKKQIISLSVRKIRIFLSTVTVAGMLFATASCVDNTESESVSALRNAKAAELNASADYLKAQATVAQTLASAQAALINAQATTEASVAKYNEALAAQAIAQGEADKLLAEAAKLRAEGQKVQFEAQAKQFEAQAKQLEAQAKQTELTAKADSARSAEALRETKRQNDLLLATLETDLKAAELAAKDLFLQQQRTYMTNVSTLNTEVQTQYLTLLGQLTTVQLEIYGLTEAIAGYELEIAQNESNLAAYFLDSTRFVTRFIARTNASVTKDSLSLEYANRDLAIWKSFETGIGDYKIGDVVYDGLNTQKQNLIDDTVKYAQALAESVAKLAVLETDTVTKATALAAVQVTHEAAKAAYEAAWEAVETASENLNEYNKVAGISSTDIDWENTKSASNSDYNGGYPISPINVLPYTIGSKTYTKELLEMTGSHYSYDYGYYRYDEYYIYDYPNAYVRLYMYSYYDGYANLIEQYYNWNINEYKTTVTDANVDRTYPTVDALLTDIKFQKDDTLAKAGNFAEARETLAKASDSLRIYGDSTYLYVSKYEPDAKKARDDAKKVRDDARDAYYEALTAFNDKTPPQTEADTAIVSNAAMVYIWKTWDLSVDLPGQGDAVDTSKEKLYNDAYAEWYVKYVRLSTVSSKYSAYRNTVVRNAIAAVIQANEDYNASVKELKDLEACEDILRLGTREALVFKLDAAMEALKAPLTAYSAEMELLAAAKKEYDNAKDDYTDFAAISLPTAQNLYNQAIERYNEVEFIDFQISLGGIETLLDLKADMIASTLDEIAYLENKLAHYQSELLDVAKYADDTNKGRKVEEVIAIYRKNIADAQKNIDKDTVTKAQKEQKAELYQTAIDLLLKEYESLSE
jgi:hypothetical protein